MSDSRHELLAKQLAKDIRKVALIVMFSCFAFAGALLLLIEVMK